MKSSHCPSRISNVRRAAGPWHQRTALACLLLAAVPAAADCVSADLAVPFGTSGLIRYLETALINASPRACNAFTPLVIQPTGSLTILGTLTNYATFNPDGQSNNIQVRGVLATGLLGTIDNQGELISWEGSIVNDGTFINSGILDSGQFISSGTVVNTSSQFTNRFGFSNTGGNLQNQGTVTFLSGMDNQGTVTNSGQFIANSLYTYVNNYGTVTNTSTGTMRLFAYVASANEQGQAGVLDNHGVLYAGVLISSTTPGAVIHLREGGTVHSGLYVPEFAYQGNDGVFHIETGSTILGSFENSVTGVVNSSISLELGSAVAGVSTGSLVNRGELNILQGSTFRINGTVLNDGLLLVRGNAVLTNGLRTDAGFNERMENNGHLTNNGTFNNLSVLVNYATLENNGTFNNLGQLASYYGQFINNGNVLNDGQMTVIGGEVLNAATGFLLNRGSASFQTRFTNEGSFQNDGPFSAAGSFVNRHAITNSAEFTVDTLEGEPIGFVNEGVILNQPGGAMRLNLRSNTPGIGLTRGTLDNRGTLRVPSGLGFGYGATVYLRDGSTLLDTPIQVADLHTQTNAGTIINNVSMELDGTLNNLGALYATANLTGAGHLANNGLLVFEGHSVASANISNYNQMRVRGHLDFGLRDAVPVAASVLTNWTSLEVEPGGTLGVHAQLLNSGTIENRGVLTVGAGASLVTVSDLTNFTTLSQDGALSNAGQVQNLGTWTQAAGATVSNALTFTNSGTFDGGGSVVNTGQMRNDGLFRVASLANQGDFLNTRDFVNLGQVTNRSSFVNQGSWTDVDGARLSRAASVPASTAIAFLNQGTLENAGRFTAVGRVVNEARIQNAGTLAVANFLNQGDVLNTATFVNWGLVSNQASFVNQGDWTDVDGAQVSRAAGIRASGTRLFENQGTFENTGSFTATGSVVNTGILKNSGTFTALAAAGLGAIGFDNSQGQMINARAGVLTLLSGRIVPIETLGRISNEGKLIVPGGIVLGLPAPGTVRPVDQFLGYGLANRPSGVITDTPLVFGISREVDHENLGTIVNNRSLDLSGSLVNFGTILSSVDITGYGVLNNRGTMVINGNAALAVAITNRVNFTVASGRTDLLTSFVNSGQTTIKSGATIAGLSMDGDGLQAIFHRESNVVNEGNLLLSGTLYADVLLNTGRIEATRLTNNAHSAILNRGTMRFSEVDVLPVVGNEGTWSVSGTLNLKYEPRTDGYGFVNRAGTLTANAVVGPSAYYTSEAGSTQIQSGVDLYEMRIRGGDVTIGGSTNHTRIVQTGGTFSAGSSTRRPAMAADGLLLPIDGMPLAEVAVGSPGTLEIGVGGLLEVTDGTLLVEVAGTAAGTYDVLQVNGRATFAAGTLQFQFLDGFVPQLGDQWTFFTGSGTVEGLEHLNVAVTGLPDGYVIDFNAATGVLTTTAVASVPEPSTVLLFALGGFHLARRQRWGCRRGSITARDASAP